MNKERRVNLFIVLLPVFVLVVLFLIAQITFELSLSPQEKRLLSFHRESNLGITERKAVALNIVRCPISMSNTSEKGFPPSALSEVAPPRSATVERVSMILVNKDKRMAVVDGRLVNEGDWINQSRVEKIERNRILLKNKKGEAWLRFE